GNDCQSAYRRRSPSHRTTDHTAGANERPSLRPILGGSGCLARGYCAGVSGAAECATPASSASSARAEWYGGGPMTWLVWRQHRGEGVIVLVVLAFFAVYLVATGLYLTNSYQQHGLSACLAPSASSACDELKQTFLGLYDIAVQFLFYLFLLPALLGALIGAPLVAREVEQRTHLLVWTQSVTRWRWLRVKVGMVLGASLLAAGALLALLNWWFAPYAQFVSRFDSGIYDYTGPVWLGATLLGLALGIFLGALTRRTVLAIFLTIVLFLVIRVTGLNTLRPNFEPPIIVTWALEQDEPTPALNVQDWQLTQGYIDAQGNKRDFRDLPCTANQTQLQCLQASGAQAKYLAYQP